MMPKQTARGRGSFVEQSDIGGGGGGGGGETCYERGANGTLRRNMQFNLHYYYKSRASHADTDMKWLKIPEHHI